MKVEIQETQYGLDINLTPENLQEVSQLFRFTNNMKKEKPSVYMTFSDSQTKCYINMSKVNRSKQVNSISK